MKGILLAAGEGTRLRPLTLDRPKAMVKVGGWPAVAYALEWLRAAGVGEVAINLCRHPEVLQDFVGDGARFGVRARYSVEAPDALGTAGALAPLREFFRGEEAFVVLYGDVLTNLDLAHEKQARILYREPLNVVTTRGVCCIKLRGLKCYNPRLFTRA